MNLKKTTKIKNVFIISFGILVSFFLLNFPLFVLGNTWSPTTSTPPQDDALGFLNTSATTQLKNAGLEIQSIFEAFIIKLNPGSETQPTCDSQAEGMMWLQEGGVGETDDVMFCIKNASDEYVWEIVISRRERADFPSAPTCEDLQTDSITISSCTGCEYSLDSGINWQDSNVFTGLNMGTSYDFISRYKENNEYLASSSSSSVSCSTIEFYTFTATFTNCSQIEKTGPSQTQCNSEYTGTTVEEYGGVVVTDGIQQWEVPQSGTYKISAYGASGGGPISGRSGRGGYGAKIEGEFALEEGQKINILVGQMGHTNDNIPTGGGGTFVVKDTSGTPGNSDILVIAGGGGGGGVGSSTTGQETSDASLTTSGKTASGTLRGSAGSGGTDGQGGGDGSARGGGGAGFFGSGGHASNTPVAQAFVNGGVGGRGSTSYSPERPGGFGGGGGSNRTTGWGAVTGGGGYSGGGGAYSSANTSNGWGGGGGSYNNGTNTNVEVLTSSGHGYVIIEALHP